MLHRLRGMMGKRDSEYILSGILELDEGFFSTAISEEENDKPLQRGREEQGFGDGREYACGKRKDKEG